MNVNLLKNFLEISRNSNKVINKVSNRSKLCSQRYVCYSSTSTESKRRNYTKNDIFLFNGTFKRCFCNNSSPPTNKLPPLMSFPQLIWPSVFKSFKNLLLATFIIKPYFDPEFNLSDFVNGSKKALEVVSHKLSSGEIKGLDGLVSSDIIPALQRTVSLLSLSQRELLSINMEDIYFAFPYQVGIIFKNEDQPQNQKRYVEITMVFHTLKGLNTMRKIGEDPPLNAEMSSEYQSKISICNYRFIKEFTKGVESDWTINLLNHFRPIDGEDWNI